MFAFKNFSSLIINVVIFLCFAVKITSTDENDNNIPTSFSPILDRANSMGNELRNIGVRVTKLENIAKRYKEMNATVNETDGDSILRTIVARMNKLIKEKVDAVMRIKNATADAESNEKYKIKLDNEAKKNVSYYNSKFSSVTLIDDRENWTLATNYEDKKPEKLAFENMTLSADQHFSNVLVNTSYSSVHVPTNIYDRWDKVIYPILWSSELDETFKENYDKDPSLMWQYFASTSGFLRHYPAYHWSMDPDKYDCRKRIWYVQAATCSKEVVILIDNSGTMYGMRNTIAQLTVDSLLQTFSNNDYVNLFQLINEDVRCLVDCFNGSLVQATPENVELFKQSLYDMCPDKKINFTKGFMEAFNILHNFIQNKTEQTERRNQAIFLLTDLLPSQSELDIIRAKYSEIYNNSNIQVDLFIYFIGKDIPEIRTVQWGNTCLRNGSIVHVRTMDEVPEDVLKYLPVIARTQNENTQNYPVSWTHVFLDIKKDKGKQEREEEKPESENDHPEYGDLNEPFIMTSVTAPVYKKVNSNLPPGKEEMIGVAAIDVPVADFERLVISHKIGVNGYAFIVTNNGYLLFHPDLTPVKDGTFRINFNSVDLTEIEFYDSNETEPRKPNERIVELRERMVNQEHDKMENMTIKFHYDNQTRVGSELRNYYYAPLKCSPFTLGLALPKGYGNYWIQTADELEFAKLKEENYSRYFDGDWNIHPKWTYCDFRTREKYNYKTPRQKLEKFLSMIFDNNTSDFPWYDEHPSEDIKKLNFTESFDVCFANDTTMKPPGYYFCDKELMEVLFFDAKLTHAEFAEEISQEDKDFMKLNGIQIKYVSTQSGFMRWKYIDDSAKKRNFGETNNKALDEIWYKSAVLLHQPKAQSFVFSLPKSAGEAHERYITASHAIFYNNSQEQEAPGVVVGYEMAYDSFKNLIEKNLQFSNDTQSHKHEYYVIDKNGYIVYAKNEDNLGKFFGEIEGAVMQRLVNESVFRPLSMYDYQAFENESKSSTPSRGSFLFNPINHLAWTVQWAFSKILWLLLETNLWPQIHGWNYCSDIDSETGKSNTSNITATCVKAPKKYSDRCNTREVPPHILRQDEGANKLQKKPVDKQFTLYLASGHEAISNENRNDSCARPFEAHRIPSTNLILISIDMEYSSCWVVLSVKQEKIKYNTSDDVKVTPANRKLLPEGKYNDIPACNKKEINSYPRKKLRGCSDKRVLNSTDNDSCGSNRFYSVEQSLFITLICHFVLLFYYLQFF